jgi:hypothetical protein
MNTSLITRAAAALLLGSVAILAQAADVNGHARASAEGAVQPLFKPGKPRVWDAVVSDAGVLIRGGALSASAVTATGAYQINMPVDVTQCTYVATLGSTSFGTPLPGMVVTASRVTDATAVFVQTYDAAGAQAARSFHLTVVCA